MERRDKTTIQNTAEGMDIDTDSPSPTEIESSAAARAIKEEVGLSREEIEAMGVRFFVVGVHQTDESAVVGRELRYWPRLFGRRVYGYPRAASTIIVAAMMSKDIGGIVLRPSDRDEIDRARFIEWRHVREEFRYGGAYNPAFGWSHTRMIEYVDSRLEALLRAFSIPQRRSSVHYHTAARIHHEAKAQAYGSMRMHRKAASHARRAAEHMRLGT